MLPYSGRERTANAHSREHPSQSLLRFPSQAAKKLNRSLMKDHDLYQHSVRSIRVEDLGAAT